MLYLGIRLHPQLSAEGRSSYSTRRLAERRRNAVFT